MADDHESDRVRSIITFPMLLQHTLRIHLSNNLREDITRILDKDLLVIFEEHWLKSEPDEIEVMTFIKLLWDVRYCFDKYVIKWVEQEDEEVHAIRRLRINDSDSGSSLSRENSDSQVGFALLQSMLYHSQQMTTQYWITPLLNYLLVDKSKNPFVYLKYIDNQLLCSGDDDPLIVRTRRFLKKPRWGEYKPVVSSDLSKDLGTKFPHYWFYKLEFILWYQLKNKKGGKWKRFRMTAKNSVEHISPQKPEIFDSNKVDGELLNSFGNLALVSRSINSEYSNKPYAEKRARFIEKNRNKLDSLKMALIYENEQWNNDLVKKHQAKMINRFHKYFTSVEDEIDKFRKEE